MTTTTTTGLIVGLGSIGKRHAKVMSQRYERLMVIDQSEAALAWARAELPNLEFAGSSLDQIKVQAMQAASITAVVASWGPHHFAAFSYLVAIGVRRIFVEKPLATSLAQLNEMRRICELQGVKLTIGHHLRYRGIAEFINSATRAHLGGGPTSFVVEGGARCIATNGSHKLDLGIALFGALPVAVTSTLRSAKVNPRSPDLLYWDGVAVWDFPSGERLCISYDNSSSVDERIRIFAPRGVIEIDSPFNLKALARNLEEVLADPRVARVGEVNSSAPVAEYVPDFGEVLSTQLDELEGLRPTSFGTAEAIDSAAALISAFEANRLGRRLELPADRDVVLQSVEWNIS